MTLVLERTEVSPALVLDVQDRYLRRRGLSGPTPRPMGAVRVTATLVVAAPAAAPPAIELLTTRSSEGFVVFHGRARPSGGGASRRPLEPGAYDLAVSARGYQPAPVPGVQIPTALPVVPVVVDLDPAPDYPFPDEVPLPPAGAARPARPVGSTLLRGSVHDAAGALAGATASAPGAEPVVTGPSGGWVLVFRPGTPAGQVQVTLSAPGKVTATSAAILVPGYRETLARVVLADA